MLCGGAALSVKAVTGRPIKLVSVGEKLDQLEFFYPDRMASRILGMGDVLSLIERAEAAVEQDEQRTLEEQMRKGQFTFDDFLSAQKMLRRMGLLAGRAEADPGPGSAAQGRQHRRPRAQAWKRSCSMTPYERAHPGVIDGKRRQRLARGSGTTVQQVNRLMDARREMEKMMKGMSKGKLPQIPAYVPDGVPPPRSRKKSKSKSKRKTRSRR